MSLALFPGTMYIGGCIEVGVGGVCELGLVPGNDVGGCMRGGCRRSV